MSSFSSSQFEECQVQSCAQIFLISTNEELRLKNYDQSEKYNIRQNRRTKSESDKTQSIDTFHKHYILLHKFWYFAFSLFSLYVLKFKVKWPLLSIIFLHWKIGNFYLQYNIMFNKVFRNILITNIFIFFKNRVKNGIFSGVILLWFYIFVYWTCVTEDSIAVRCLNGWIKNAPDLNWLLNIYQGIYCTLFTFFFMPQYSSRLMYKPLNCQ